MWTKVLLALALTALIVIGVYSVLWLLLRGLDRFRQQIPWDQAIRRLRNPWEEEDQAWEALHRRVEQLDPDLLPSNPERAPDLQGPDQPPRSGNTPQDPT